ncbi:LysE family translocator [Litoribacter ruber]|uniref:LysE family translocator n=1 Tax=Litoribacter ruber TaxID=702568 RepID=A0AAP2CG41_9BACT|nr:MULTISPECIES: LysE family translocator [Litoribacter]MBS9522869.1 LysE family translocator [Litoribacter alkaliphilus]MBT0812377.1 LysE family translocator [Litoribacter ruber]
MNVIEGIGMGLVLSLIIGPVFFALIQSSIEKGFRYAVAMAAGILLSDSLYVLLTYFGVSLITNNPMVEMVLGFVGGGFLVAFGVLTFMKKGMGRPNTGGFPKSKKRPMKRKGFAKGFSLNGVNPFVLLFWTSIAGLVHLKDGFGALDVVGYYLGILLTVFLIDVLKAYSATKLRTFITPKIMQLLNKVVAVALVGFGIRLIVFAAEAV